MPTADQTFSRFREQVLNHLVKLEVELYAIDLALLNQAARVDLAHYREMAQKSTPEISARVRKSFPESLSQFE